MTIVTCAHCGGEINLDYDMNFQLPDGRCFHARCIDLDSGPEPQRRSDDLP